MTERLVNISFPVKESFLLSLNENKDQFKNEMLFSSALHLYRKGKLSLGKASEFAGLLKTDFIKKIKDEGGYIFDYSDEEMDEIFNDNVNLF